MNAAELAAVRFARPTDKLDEVLRFYEEGLGLERIDSFEDHAGYSGVMLGLPGEECHLELTEHADGSPGRAPTRDNLLVLYLTTEPRSGRSTEGCARSGTSRSSPRTRSGRTTSPSRTPTAGGSCCDT